MTSERPSNKLLILLGVCVLLGGGVYGRMLLSGGDETEPAPGMSPEAVPYDTEPAATTDDPGEPGTWTLPEQPRNPFQAVPLGG